MGAPRRPWWRRRRWQAAVALSTVLPPALFLAAEGPVLYAVGRGRLPLGAYNRVYAPFWQAVEPALPYEWRVARVRYRLWWMDVVNGPRSPD